jgi:hypothetical protein
MYLSVTFFLFSFFCFRRHMLYIFNSDWIFYGLTLPGFISFRVWINSKRGLLTYFLKSLFLSVWNKKVWVVYMTIIISLLLQFYVYVEITDTSCVYVQTCASICDHSVLCCFDLCMTCVVDTVPSTQGTHNSAVTVARLTSHCRILMPYVL